MTFAWHITKKDFHLQRTVVASWILLSLVTVADRLIAPRFDEGSRWPSSLLSPWLFTIGMSYLLVLMLCIANVIQADRVVGTTAFWLTRPIPRGTVLRAKLLGLFLFVVVPSLVIEGVMLAAFHVSATTIAAALLQQAWTLAVFMLVIVLGAALTSTVVRLLLTIIGALIVIYFAPALVFLLAWPLEPTTSADVNWNPPYLFFDPIDLDDTTFKARRGQPVRYVGSFYFALDRHETLAKMPLTVGAGYNDGARSVLVEGLRHGRTGCVVSLRTTSVGLFGRSLSYPELAVRYRGRDGADLVDPSAPLRRASPGQHAASRYDAIPASLLHTFDLERRDAYPLPTRGSNQSIGPPCEEITLEVERVRYAGHLKRTLDLRDFRLDDPFATPAR